MATPRYCTYYQATVSREHTWFVVGCLKNEPNISFDRTLDAQAGLLEFFVSPDCEDHFLSLMDYFTDLGYVHNLQKAPNRCEVEKTI